MTLPGPRMMRRCRSTAITAFVLLLVAAPAGAERGDKPAEPLDASLREVVHRVPVTAVGAQIVVTSFFKTQAIARPF
jgi:hypothetical protein